VSGRTAVRVALAYLAGSGLFVGVWAAAAPRSFFSHFPGLGLAWTVHDGPYNEHLVRDVGDLNLALALLTIVAVVWTSRTLAAAAAGAWIVYSVPHLAYHAANLQTLSSSDHVPELAALAVPVALGAVILVVARRDELDAGARTPG
jgi:hypothetical protein